MSRNIIFLLIDCLRGDLVLGEGRHVRTPVIDGIVGGGTAFRQAISTCSITSPSVASLLTGVYPFVHGIRALRGHKLAPGVRTLGEVLREGGYHSYAMASGTLHPALGLGRGFDEYDYRKHEDKYVASAWGDRLKDRLRKGGLKEPYFLFFHFWELHKPRHVPRPYRSAVFGRNRYERAFSALDVEIGEILEAAGGDPIVIIHGDHGEHFPGNTPRTWISRLLAKMKIPVDFRSYWEGHGFGVWEPLVRVPLVFRGGDIFPAGGVIDRQVRQVDIPPTILDAVGIPPPDGIHGESLLPVLRGEAGDPPPAFMEACGTMIPRTEDWLTAIRVDGWKYVCALQNSRIPEQLFCLDEDPEERTNLSRERPEQAKALRERMLEILQSKDLVLPGETMSAEEADEVGERLKDLGYM